MIIRFAIALCLALAIDGCAFPPDAYRGNLVTAGQVVALPSSGSHSGSWDTFDVAIAYDYSRTGDTLEISGSCLLSQHYRGLYSYLSDLRVLLFFVDEQSRVVAAIPLARSLTYGIEDALDFSGRFTIPAGATAMSFGYDGRVYEYEDGKSFYLLPLGK